MRYILIITTSLLLLTFNKTSHAQLAPLCSDPPFIVENAYESVQLFGCDGPVTIRDVAIDGDWAAFSGFKVPGDPKGHIYMFHFNGTEWEAHSKFRPSGLVFADEFGHSLTLKNGKLLVGAPGNFSVTDGKAYLYAYDGTSWVEEHVFTPDAGLDGRYFGTGLEILETGYGFDLIYVGGLHLVSVYRVNATYDILGTTNVPNSFRLGRQIAAEGEWLFIYGKRCYIFRYNGSKYVAYDKFSSAGSNTEMIAMDFPSVFYDTERFRGEIEHYKFDGTDWNYVESFRPEPEYAACGYTGGHGGSLKWDLHAEDDNLFLYGDDRRFMNWQAGVIYWYQRASASAGYELKATYTNPAARSGNWRIGEKMDYSNGKLVLKSTIAGTFDDYITIVDVDKICVPPTNLTAVPTVGGVTLSWDAVPGASKYKVRVKDCMSSGTPSDDILIDSEVTTATSAFIPLAAGNYEWDIETVCSMNTSERFGNFNNSFVVPTLRTAASHGDLKVFPNPVSSSGITTVTSGESIERLWISDISGRQVEATVTQLSATVYRVDLSELPSGLYFIFGDGEETISQTKIIIE